MGAQLSRSMSSARRGFVIEFLLCSRYSHGRKVQGAASDFKREPADRGLDWESLSEEDQDWSLAEHLVEGYYSERKRPWGLTLASALQKMSPARRFKTAWKVLDACAVHVPTQQAHPCPREVAWASSIVLFVW